MPLVPRNVASDLWHPIARVAFHRSTVWASIVVMPVPKAAMDEDHFSSCGEYKIRLARQIASMDAIAIAETVKKPSNR